MFSNTSHNLLTIRRGYAMCVAICTVVVGTLVCSAYGRPPRFGRVSRSVFNSPRRPRPRFNTAKRPTFNMPRDRSPFSYREPSRRTRLKEPPVDRAPSRSKETVPSQAQLALATVLKSAIDAYRQLQWSQASGLFRQVISAGGVANSEKWQAWIFLGAIAYQSGHAEEAERCFRQAHQSDSAKVPSDVLFPPQMLDFYQKLRPRK